jgi:hypothetical protein
MLSRFCLLILPAALLCSAEVIDRIAVTVGRQVISLSDVLREIRLTAFLNGEEPDLSPANKRLTADRLIEQALIRREMELSRYQPPEPTQAEPMLAQIKRERFPTDSIYRETLAKYDLSEEELKQHLLKQLATLRFVDLRFQAGIQVPESEMQKYYEKRLLPEWHNKDRKPVPPFAEVRAEIERILIAEQVDRLMDDWLRATRARMQIDYREEAFQ